LSNQSRRRLAQQRHGDAALGECESRLDCPLRVRACGFVYLTWVIPSPPKSVRSQWWFGKIAVKLLAWIVATWSALALVVLLIQVLVTPS
jgi:hypothetical protein